MTIFVRLSVLSALLGSSLPTLKNSINPHPPQAMRQQVLSQLRATRPEMAAQAEALLSNPGMVQNVMQAMQANPGLMQQAQAMMGGQQAGVPPAMPGYVLCC